jgi:dethiobiotin synthetase
MGKSAKKILFVTGTDTGVGKTVLTATMLAFLRQGGGRVLAMKPFCSGPRDDALLLHSLQKGCLTLDDVNPFYFDKPLAPAAAARPSHPAVPLAAALRKIHNLASRCDLLIVEGVGGLMVPLGRQYSVRDLIRRLDCKVLVVCSNRLGTLNHTLLTAEALKVVGIKEFTIVMMSVRNPDISSRSNHRMIREKLPGIPIFCLGYLGNGASTMRGAKENVKKVKKTLAAIAGDGILRVFFNRTKRLRNKPC